MEIGDVQKAASDFLYKANRWNRRDGCLFRISKAEFPLTAAARDADTFVGFHQKSEGKDKTMLQGRKHPASTRLGVEAMIREDILQKFPELFGTKTINGREVHVEQAIAELARELGPPIAAALTARRALLGSPAPVREKYAWPKWDDTFEDPVTAQSRTFRQIVQGLIDNFLGRDSQWRWRLNDEAPIPEHAHPTRNPGLELTGPWHPLDMAFNALNSPAPMNMPDFEDASPPHFQPDGTPANEPVGIFAALQNAKEIHEGRWTDRAYEVTKKGKKRSYRITTPQAKWPTRLAPPPSIHVRYDHVTVDGKPAPGIVAVVT